MPSTRPRSPWPLLIAISIVLAACGPGAEPNAESPSGTVPSQATPSTAPTAAPTLGDTRTDPFGIAQVWVPAGSFQMGSDEAAIAALAAADPSPPPWVATEFPSEQPAHEVRLTEGFWIDRDEVTNGAFDAFVAAGGYTTEAFWSPEGWAWVGDRDVRGLPKRCPGDGPDLPRRCITWYEAAAYAAWRGGALPTEAQWEFAARGPEATIYPWGNEWDATVANVVDSAGAVAVGSYPGGVSWVGANDMAGNAMEWVADWLGPYGAPGPTDDPTGPATGEVKVEKGGWWGSNPFVARSAYRHFEDPPTYGDKHIGFRIVSD